VSSSFFQNRSLQLRKPHKRKHFGFEKTDFQEQYVKLIALDPSQLRNEKLNGLSSSFAEFSKPVKTELCAEKLLRYFSPF